ncbi:hypothetical protein [Marivirga harenae]|uniref:hypothetical protein n=1 Tax=Marivirga harenae TaxID=2010992 RepID=UPI0026E054F1|nr:hypothetical protein [Marivirga harenae]WKV13748.1 hypothetical protein Q3Y49_07890 [Marivirga harenae]
MKKITIIILVIIGSLFAFDTNGQSFEKGDNILNAGLGFGYYGYGFVYNRSFSIPAITANYEVGLGEFIGVGPYVGIASWNYSGSGFNGGYSIFAVGGRATFHLTDVLLNELLELDVDEKWDFYATLIMGLNFDLYSGDFQNIEANQVRLSAGPIFGFRYLFSKNFGMYLEGGRGSFSYGTIGLSLKM